MKDFSTRLQLSSEETKWLAMLVCDIASDEVQEQISQVRFDELVQLMWHQPDVRKQALLALATNFPRRLDQIKDLDKIEKTPSRVRKWAEKWAEK